MREHEDIQRERATETNELKIKREKRTGTVTDREMTMKND